MDKLIDLCSYRFTYSLRSRIRRTRYGLGTAATVKFLSSFQGVTLQGFNLRRIFRPAQKLQIEPMKRIRLCMTTAFTPILFGQSVIFPSPDFLAIDPRCPGYHIANSLAALLFRRIGGSCETNVPRNTPSVPPVVWPLKRTLVRAFGVADSLLLYADEHLVFSEIAFPTICPIS